MMSQTVGFISSVVLKACENKSPTLEEPMVKGEKLGAVNHRDVEGFSVSICFQIREHQVLQPTNN